MEKLDYNRRLQYLTDLLKMAEESPQYKEGFQWAVGSISILRHEIQHLQETIAGVNHLRKSSMP
jgi:hypothetical protein